MNEDQFHIRLLGIRGLVRELLAGDVTDRQRCDVGSELMGLSEEINDHFRRTGKFYRKRQDG